MASKNSAKDSAMAARLKAKGDIRARMRCPVCHRVIRINDLQGHLRVNACQSYTKKK